MKLFYLSIYSLVVLLAFGCVSSPEGKVELNSTVKQLVGPVARAAVLVGISRASQSVSELRTVAPYLAEEVYTIFEAKENPEEIGKSLKELFASVGVELANRELEKLLAEHVAEELLPEVPGAYPGGVEQYQYNKDIVAAFDA